MSVEMTQAERKAGGIWTQYFLKLISELKKKEKINPKHAKEMREYFKMYNFANQTALHLNEFDGIVRDPDERKKFLKTNSNIEADLLDEIWFNLLIFSTLRCYWAIESSLVALLRGVEYGKKGTKVQGTETLGKLKTILEILEIKKFVDWTAIDIKFRNALAHGWFYRKKQKFVYFNNARLKHGHLLTVKELIHKCRLVQLYAIAIAGVVGEWQKLKNFGSKDPLKKVRKKR